MAWGRRAVSFGALAQTASLVITKPASTADGDILVAGIYQEADTNTINSVPSGWTLVVAEVVNTSTAPDHRLSVYWKRAASEGASYTWGFSSSSNWVEGIMIAYSGGLVSGDPVDVTNTGTGTSTTASVTTVTTTVDGVMKVLLVGNFQGNDYTGSASGMTERGDGTAFGLYDEEQTTAGATGTESCTLSASAEFAARLVVLKPPTAATKAPPPPRAAQRVWYRTRRL